MDEFLGLKEAASFSGRSESTLKRLIVRVLDEHRHDQSLIDQVIKKRQAAKGYYWFISKAFLIEEFGLDKSVDDHGRSDGRPKGEAGEPMDDQMAGHRTLEHEIIAILKEQLRVKDEQIRNFQERDREYNILLKTFQDKLFLLESGRAQDNSQTYQEQTSGSGREEAAASEDPFGAAAPWPEEETAFGEQDVPEAETPLTVEELAATGEGGAEAEQGSVAEQTGGAEETEGAPAMTRVNDAAPVGQAPAISVPTPAILLPAEPAAEIAAPAAATPTSVSAEEGAGEGSGAAPAPAKKKGFWRRVFGG